MASMSYTDQEKNVELGIANVRGIGEQFDNFVRCEIHGDQLFALTLVPGKESENDNERAAARLANSLSELLPG